MSPFLGTRGAGSSRAFGYAAAAAPNQVTGLTATDFGTNRAYNDGRIDLSWNTPANNGATISGYLIERSTDGSSYSVLVGNTGSATTTYSNTGLSSNQIYYYRVSAINVVGTGLASTAANATSTTIPQAPTIGTASVTGTTASITFTANATGGKAVSTYTATSSPGSITGTSASSPVSVAGLTAGTTYTFTITATNANGTSIASASSNSVTPVAYFTMGWTSYYPYNISARPTDGMGIVGYSSGPGVGNALVGPTGSVITNGNVYTNLSNAGSPQSNAYGIDSSGNSYWLATVSNNPYIISHDSSQNVRWQRRITNNAGYTSVYFSGAHLGRDNNFYVWGGYQVTGGAEPDSRYFLHKINSSNGNTTWAKDWSSNVPIQSVGVDSSGNVNVQFYNQQIIGYNSSGTQLYRKAMNGTFNNSGKKDQVADSAGNFYIGTAINTGEPALMKINSSGTPQWGRIFRWSSITPSLGATALAIDSSDNIYYLQSTTDLTTGVYIVKLNSSGSTIWKRRMVMTNTSGGGAVYGYSIDVSPDGTILYICGQTVFGSPYGNIGWVFKMPSDGSKTGTYDMTGGGFTMNLADSGSLSLVNITDLSADNNSYGTLTNSSSAGNTTASLTFTTTSNFNGQSAVVTNI